MVKKKTGAKNKKIAAGVSAGLAAAGAAAAGYYYFYASKDAAKHRKVATKWAGDLKRDVVREARKLKDVSRADIAAIADAAAKTYKNMQGVDEKEVRRAVSELKENWHQLEREAKRTAKKTAKKVVKKAKTAKKVAKKSKKAKK